jgi:NAD(P)-dependent dehydrogenase (short-subunit alcohol dehydrogenase family)
MDQFAGKVAVVTGGANGIGRGIVEALLERDARVVIADIERLVLDATVAELSARGDVYGVVTDVSQYESVEALADEVFARYGACHLLFNNAGWSAVGAGGERLAMVLRRERVRCGERRARVRSANARVGRGRRDREHVLG